MKREKRYLTYLEELTLLALLQCNRDACARAILSTVQRYTGQLFYLSLVYHTLNRLISKGLVSRSLSSSVPVSGGRCCLNYKIEPAGIDEILKLKASREAMWSAAGLELESFKQMAS